MAYVQVPGRPTRQLERPFPSPIKPVPILRVGSVGSVLPLHCKAKPAVPPSPRSWAWTPRKVPEPVTPSRPKASAPRSPERGALFTPPRPERKAEYVTVTVPEPPEPVKSEKVPEPPVPPPPKIPVITHPHYAIRRQVCQQVLLTNLPVGVEEHHIVRQLDAAGLEQPFVVQVNQEASTCTLFYPQVSKSADMLVEEDHLLFEHAGGRHLLPATLMGKVELMWTDPRCPRRGDQSCEKDQSKGSEKAETPREPGKEAAEERAVESTPALRENQSCQSIQNLAESWVQRLGSEELPSVGSTWHYKHSCRPCRFLLTGCKRGKSCDFCHLCDGTQKRRRVEKADDLADMDGSTEAGESLPSSDASKSSVEVKSETGETEENEPAEPEISHEDMASLIGRLWPKSEPSDIWEKPKPRAARPRARRAQNRKLSRFLKLHGKKLWSGSRKVKRRADTRRPSEPAEPPRKPMDGTPLHPTLSRHRTSDWQLEREVAVRELRYSQRTCGSYFRCGRKCEDLVRDLHEKKVDPRTADFLVLDVIRKRDARGRSVLWSADNRRLWALKKFQQYTQGEIKVRVRFQGDFHALKRFERNLDTDCDGRYIKFRKDSHKWLRNPLGPARRRRGGRR
ncbi:GALNT15 [Symbiodinium necroappetens]|uniref:GALNT15 protein n=1 Tax=Symbiodinium necroappetens TaxID=1628268 RepID=A0A812X0N3_9DINO|nr:GALNT15 [Symbiodinium necroappetens]